MKSGCDSNRSVNETTFTERLLASVGTNQHRVSRPVPRRTLRRALLLAVIVGVTSGSTGCRLCCNSEDVAFPAYGGVWERTQRNEGRVGSLFDPAGARSSSLSPRDSGEAKENARGSIAPFAQPMDDESDPSQERTDPEPRSDEERQRQFEERRDRLKEKMLNAKIIPGEPSPPVFR